MARPARRFVSLLALASLALIGMASAADAQNLSSKDFPSKPVRIIVPYTPGSPNDVMARLLAQQLQGRLGQAVVVDNKPGGGTTIGSKAAAGAPPDGYTLAQMPATVLRVPLISARPPFNPLTDFTWIIQLTGYLFGVVVRADAPWRSFREFLDEAKAHPGKIVYGTPGAITTPNVVMVQVAAKEGIASGLRIQVHAAFALRSCSR